jgi:hypothetical protein
MACFVATFWSLLNGSLRFRLSAVAPETLLPHALGRAIAENQCYTGVAGN